MTLQSIITLNDYEGTATDTFADTTFISTIIYDSGIVTFSARNAVALSKDDFILFCKYYAQFNSVLYANFPEIGLSIKNPISVAEYKISIPNGHDTIDFYQANEPPHKVIYDISVNKTTKLASFARRNSDIAIPIQEFILGYKLFALYAEQVQLVI